MFANFLLKVLEEIKILGLDYNPGVDENHKFSTNRSIRIAHFTVRDRVKTSKITFTQGDIFHFSLNYFQNIIVGKRNKILASTRP